MAPGELYAAGVEPLVCSLADELVPGRCSRSVPLGGAVPSSRIPAPSEVREKPQSYSAIWNAFRKAPPQMNRNASELTFAYDQANLNL